MKTERSWDPLKWSQKTEDTTSHLIVKTRCRNCQGQDEIVTDHFSILGSSPNSERISSKTTAVSDTWQAELQTLSEVIRKKKENNYIVSKQNNLQSPSFFLSCDKSIHNERIIKWFLQWSGKSLAPLSSTQKVLSLDSNVAMSYKTKHIST